MNAGQEGSSAAAQLLQAGHNATSGSNHTATHQPLVVGTQLELDEDGLEPLSSGMPLPWLLCTCLGHKLWQCYKVRFAHNSAPFSSYQ